MLTITEWAKLNPQPLASGIVEVFARTNPVLELLPFINIAGSAYKYNQEQTLPGVAFRDFNNGYSESTGVVNPVIETLTILGGDSDFDIAQVAMQTGNNDIRAAYDGMKAKSLSLEWLKTFLHGSTATDPLSFDGLQRRLTGEQVIAAGANGGDLQLTMLDELIDAVRDTPSILLMNRPMRRKVNALIRAAGSAIETVSDSFGRQVQAYAGIPIGSIDRTPSDGEIMPFAETMGTSNSTASIYAVAFGIDNVHGIQTQPMDVRDLGELEVKPAFRTRIEWYSGFTVKHGRAAARLAGINQPAA
jgi:hypothetical protein